MVTCRVVAEPFLDLAEVELSGLISVPESGQEDEDSEAAGEAEQQVSPEQQPEAKGQIKQPDLYLGSYKWAKWLGID